MKDLTSLSNKAGKETITESILRIVTGVFMLSVMVFLTIVSVLHTTKIEYVDGEREKAVFYDDKVILNLFLLVIGIVFFFVIRPYLKKFSFKGEVTFISLWTIFLGLIWVFSSQTAVADDSGWVTNTALQFSQGDYSAFEQDYFRYYPYQLGYVFFNEILMRIFSVFGEIEKFLFLEVINVFLLVASYISIMLINRKIFKNEMVQHFTVLFLMFSFQPIIYTGFLYGIIPGLAFALYAIYFEIMYLKESKIQYGILSAVLIALAVMVKNNYMIILVAMVLVASATLLRRKKFILDGLYIVIACVLALSINPAVKGMYEHRSGADLGDGIPKICWFAMGLSESSMAPGWYNSSCTVANFQYAGHDADIATETAKDIIKERLEYFSENPDIRKDFFFKKVTSQWNETSYESTWINKVQGSYQERGEIANKVLYVKEDKVKRFMDIHTQLIFVAVLAGIISCLGKRNIYKIIFPLIILGGFLFHFLSEGKSQYILPYFVFMAAFAPYGMFCICEFLQKGFAPVDKKFGITYKLQCVVNKVRDLDQ